MYDDNDDKNKKHNYIVNSLHALFPSKTMKQVTHLYIDLAVEMHMSQRREGTHVTSGSPQNIFTFCYPVNGNYELLPMEENGASSTHGIYTMGDHANENFGVREEATIVDNNGLSFGCAMENTGITVTGEAPLMADNNKMKVLENNISIDQPVVAPHQWGFWTDEEHSMGGLVNENFEVQEDEGTAMDDNRFSFHCALEDTRIRKTEEAPMMVDKNKMVVLENNTSVDRPAVAAHQRKFW
uniref:HTH 3-helical bundle domain-containing protein n=2 Tax=Aegilops tauschii TaxID=37682 RepID=A0A453QVS1_AEGTS